MAKKILIRQTNWIGDAVMTMPAMDLLHEAFPGEEIWMAARPWVAPLFEALPWIRGIIQLEKGSGMARVPALLSHAGRIRQQGFRLGLLFPNSFESALLFLLAGIPERAGYATDFRGVLLNRKIPVPPDKRMRHEVFFYLNLVSRLTGLPVPKEPEIRLQVPGAGKAGADRLLSECGLKGAAPLIGFNPGAAYGPAKCWPKGRWVELGRMFLSSLAKCRIVILGTKREEAAFGQMASQIGRGAVSLAGRTGLAEAMGVIERLDLLVTNDSGLMHIGAGLATPLVAIFGSTNPVTTGPWSKRALVVRHELECSPCLRRTCPGEFECMRSISADEVMDAAMSLLSGGGKGA